MIARFELDSYREPRTALRTCTPDPGACSRRQPGPLYLSERSGTVKKDDAYYDATWRKERAAGPVLTNLIHEIDYLWYICGLGTFLLSDQSPSPWGWELGTGENPALPPTGMNWCRFMGTAAALEFPHLILWRHQGDPMSWDHLIASATLPMPFEDAYSAQCQHFSAVIRGDETPRINARDGANTLCATLAVLEAAETGQRVVLHISSRLRLRVWSRLTTP